jgi:hypothetical protein
MCCNKIRDDAALIYLYNLIPRVLVNLLDPGVNVVKGPEQTAGTTISTHIQRGMLQ